MVQAISNSRTELTIRVRDKWKTHMAELIGCRKWDQTYVLK